jgi:small GTP-binding protein
MDINSLEKNIRDRIELLGEISESWALNSEEKSHINRLQKDFRNRINVIKHLRLGVIGEFNAGKSTLINSILGKEVLKTSDRPCTHIPVYIKSGKNEQLKVVYDDSTTRVVPIPEYSLYTTEGDESRGVKHLVATVDSQLLKMNKIILVDTPGINSINPSHTAATLKSLKNMHAAVLLIYSKQPGSRSTIEFLQQAADQVHKIFICISKADFLAQNDIDRIIRDLPERLTKSSGIRVDKVHPIQFSDNGDHEGLTDFLKEINIFMVGEWYEIISKDLQEEMGKYSRKATDLLSNRLSLQEKMFFKFMQSTPTDFTKIEKTIKTSIRERIDRDFSIDHFNNLIGIQCDLCRSNVHAKLIADLNPFKKNYKIFKKRITKKEIQKAYENSMLIFHRLLDYDYSLENKIARYKADIEKLAMKELSQIYSTLSEFDKKVSEELRHNEEIKRQAGWVRLKPWLVFFSLILSGMIVSTKFFRFIPNTKWLVSAFIVMSLIISVWLYLCPKEEEVEYLVNQRMKSMKKHPIPRFSVDSLAEKFNPKHIYFKKDSFFQTFIQKIYYFKRPVAEDIFKEFVANWELNIKQYKEHLLTNYKYLPRHLMTLGEEYVTSLYENYSSIIDDAFNDNKILAQKFEDTIKSLKIFISKLNELNIMLRQNG